MWVVLCLTGSFSSKVPYRGWCVRVSKDGKMIPTASGIRSPGGIGLNAKGEAFYCDNQGPWNGTSSLKHLTPGSFQGHPGGFGWFDLDEVKEAMGPEHEKPKDGSRFHEEMDRLPHYRPPAILFPTERLEIRQVGSPRMSRKENSVRSKNSCLLPTKLIAWSIVASSKR